MTKKLLDHKISNKSWRDSQHSEKIDNKNIGKIKTSTTSKGNFVLPDHFNIIKKFMNKVNQSRTCWLWIGGKDGHGYGSLRVKDKKIGVHRISYELFKEKIPKNLEIDHLCKNIICCNPDHLEAVTHQENVKRGDAGKNQITNYNKNKTFCKYNHPFTNRNLIIRKNGNRVCRICNNNRVKKSYYKLKFPNPKPIYSIDFKRLKNG